MVWAILRTAFAVAFAGNFAFAFAGNFGFAVNFGHKTTHGVVSGPKLGATRKPGEGSVEPNCTSVI
ncbi:MAG: hypothetical protein GX868_04415 [Actinobacteria bacterium]|nr:hypothetical protein [Actinomycetota bacterium]